MDEYGKAEEVSCQDCGIGMSIPGPNGEHRCAGCWMQDSARRIHTLTSRLAESEAELATERERTEELRDGPIGPYESCSDCGRKMVWSHAGTVSPTWMCPRCTLRRAQLAESSLAAARAEAVKRFAEWYGINCYEQDVQDAVVRYLSEKENGKKEVIKLTRGQYGNKEYEEFFAKTGREGE